MEISNKIIALWRELPYLKWLKYLWVFLPFSRGTQQEYSSKPVNIALLNVF